MSTITNPQTATAPPEAEDRFRYGWRHVRRLTDDGEEVYDRVPLTPGDLLFPEEGDYIVTSDPQDNDRIYLKTVAKKALADDPNALVLSDHRIDLALAGVPPLGSDLAVIVGVRQRKRPGATFYVADEGVKPSLLGEITSPDTRNNDLGIKVELHHRAGIPWYIIVDGKDREVDGIVHLIGYRYTPEKYERMTPNDRGWLWLEPLKLWLGTEGPEVRCFDTQGKPIGDYTAIARALESAESQAKEAAARAQDAEARAAAEAEKRQELEARLREIEEKLRKPTGNGPSPSLAE